MKKTKTELLDKYLELIQKKNFDANLTNALKRKKRETIKKIFLLLSGPLLMFLSISLFNLPLFICSSIITLGSIIAVNVKEIKHEIDMGLKGNKIDVYSRVEEKLDTKQVLESTCVMKRGSDFYSDLVVEELSRPETEDERKYREAVFRQQLQYQNFAPLGLQDTIISISEEIHDYTLIYNLPPIDIEPSIWESFFSNVFQAFSVKGDITDYYSYMSELSRMVCAKALIANSESIDINHFLDELHTSLIVTDDDMDNIVRSIKKEINRKRKIINIDDLRK